MSYPLAIQPLVIEDEEGAKEAYQDIFKNIGDSGLIPFPISPPCFAFSHEEAVELLDGSNIFHVVTLDLRLPKSRKLPAADDIDLGLDLLTRCVNRDRYPIPSLLVISGHIGSTEQARMQEKVHNGVYSGRLLAKGPYLENEIREACTKAIKYCAVGIHVRDSGENSFPAISPRDEDLLRRSVLERHEANGLDLEWWSAKRSRGTAYPWIKVLMGRYLLNGGLGASRPNFFKLLNGSDAQIVISSARLMEHKLPHIKFTGSVTAQTTALIVSEKVGSADARPKSLHEIFKGNHASRAYEIAVQIADQLDKLGDRLAESMPLNKLLWPHDIGILIEQWARFQGEVKKRSAPDFDPIDLHSKLSVCDDRLRFNMCSLVHGDLHLNNVALDAYPHKEEAYIFDPCSIKRDVAGRDLAALEVAALLHQRVDPETLSQIFSLIYGSPDPLDKDSILKINDPLARNIVEFIRALRERAAAWNEIDIYALMVFDFTLMQVEGLALEYSGNFISDPASASLLLAFVGKWYSGLRDLSQDHGTDASADFLKENSPPVKAL